MTERGEGRALECPECTRRQTIYVAQCEPYDPLDHAKGWVAECIRCGFPIQLVAFAETRLQAVVARNISVADSRAREKFKHLNPRHLHPVLADNEAQNPEPGFNDSYCYGLYSEDARGAYPE